MTHLLLTASHCKRLQKDLKTVCHQVVQQFARPSLLLLPLADVFPCAAGEVVRCRVGHMEVCGLMELQVEVASGLRWCGVCVFGEGMGGAAGGGAGV